ncbi:MAG: hypothetical protein NTY22_04640 [Proteobacteria bacterium]|nr:hypothetical protein [Pseudomonadota bacterium]
MDKEKSIAEKNKELVKGFMKFYNSMMDRIVKNAPKNEELAYIAALLKTTMQLIEYEFMSLADNYNQKKISQKELQNQTSLLESKYDSRINQITLLYFQTKNRVLNNKKNLRLTWWLVAATVVMAASSAVQVLSFFNKLYR